MKMRSLNATANMLRLADADPPQQMTSYYSKYTVYHRGLYLRCLVQNNILKVAFYLPEHMRSGGRKPVYELYVDKERQQFLTYDRMREKWLTAKLDMLPWPDYVRASERKWICEGGYDTIQKYLGVSRGGYEGLLEYQLQVRSDELKRRHKRETDKWDAHLAQVPELPKDWQRWVDKVGIRENYIFYHYTRKGADSGYCTYCEKEVPIKNPRHNKQGHCPCCRRPVTFKSVGKAGTVLTERNYFYLLQRCADGFVIREFQGHRKYWKGVYQAPECSHWEIRRVLYNPDVQYLQAYYWGLYKQTTHRWIPCGPCTLYWWGNQDGRIYGKTLAHLAKQELRRTGLAEAYSYAGILDPEKYLVVLDKVPQLEKIAKAQLPRLVSECMSSYYHFTEGLAKPDAQSLTEIMGIDTQELKRLRRNNGGWRFLGWLQYEKISGKPLPDQVINWFCKEEIIAAAG